MRFGGPFSDWDYLCCNLCQLPLDLSLAFTVASRSILRAKLLKRMSGLYGGWKAGWIGGLKGLWSEVQSPTGSWLLPVSLRGQYWGQYHWTSLLMSIALPLFTEPVTSAQKAGRVVWLDLSLLSPRWLFPITCLFLMGPVTASRRYAHNLSKLSQPACSSLDTLSPFRCHICLFSSHWRSSSMTKAFQRWQKAIAVSFSTLGCIPSPMDFCPTCLQATYTVQYQNTTSIYDSMLRSHCQEVQSSSCVFLEKHSHLCSSVWEIKQKIFLVSVPLLCN